jgi:O-acetyl-ADP-ribose deacetylase (regulator of RNase III)
MATSAPPATQVFSELVKFIKNGLNPALIPRGQGKRPSHFQKAISELTSGNINNVSESQARDNLYHFFITAPDEVIATVPEELIKAHEAILKKELDDAQPLTDANDILKESKFEGVAVWRGDMSRFKCSAMVNPANGDLLGCFQYKHRCLDNILHAASGPRLRIACKHMKVKNHIDWDDNGKCRVTEAFALPAEYVFHTVGPDLNERGPGGHYLRDPTKTDFQELTSCYETCMRTGSELKVSSIAFCCISTGVFGYPAEEACEIALKTVKRMRQELAKEGKHVPGAVFNTFLEKDYNLYLELIGKVFNAPEDAKKKTEVVVAEEKSEEKKKNNDNDDDS